MASCWFLIMLQGLIDRIHMSIKFRKANKYTFREGEVHVHLRLSSVKKANVVGGEELD